MVDLFETVLERAAANVTSVITGTRELRAGGLVDHRAWMEATADVLTVADRQMLEVGSLAYLQQLEQLEATTAIPEPPKNLQPINSETGIRRALRTIAGGEDEEQIGMQLIRLTESLLFKSSQHGYRQAMLSDTAVDGWYRGLNAAACQLCVWWWREGQIWEKKRPLQTHTGCKCQQVPVRAGAPLDTDSQREIQERNERIAKARRIQTGEELAE